MLNAFNAQNYAGIIGGSLAIKHESWDSLRDYDDNHVINPCI